MIVHSCILPNTPLLLERIGKENAKKAETTLEIFEQMRQNIIEEKPDAFVVISPSVKPRERLGLNYHTEYVPSFEEFGDLSAYPRFKPEPQIHSLLKESLLANEYFELSSISHLDYEAVPVLLLNEGLSTKPIVPIHTGSMDTKTHFDMGKKMGKVLSGLEKKIVVIATGNLTHHHIEKEELQTGSDFDQTFINILTGENRKLFFQMSEESSKKSHESLSKSVAVLLGIHASQNTNIQIHSYESPFDVGLMTASLIQI